MHTKSPINFFYFVNTNVLSAQAQYNEVNQVKCGECGDEWSIERLRPNEEGGQYARNLIGHKYNAGDVYIHFLENLN